MHKTKNMWGRELGERIHKAYALWRSRHPEVRSVMYCNASKDAGMWTACVSINTRDGSYGPVGRSNMLGQRTPEEVKFWDAPDWKAYRSDWAPTEQDCKRRAVEDFEQECATR